MKGTYASWPGGADFSDTNDDADIWLDSCDVWLKSLWDLDLWIKHMSTVVLGRGFLFYSTNLSLGFQPHATISQWLLLWIFIPVGLYMSLPQFPVHVKFIFYLSTIWYGLPDRRQICKNNKVTIKPPNTVPITRLKVNSHNDFNNRKLRIIPRLWTR